MNIFKTSKFDQKLFLSLLALAFIPLLLVLVIYLLPNHSSMPWVIVGTMVLIIALARMLATRLTRPLSQLTGWVEQLVKNEQGTKYDFKDMGELGSLINNIQHLWQQIKDNNRQNELENWQKDGEAKLNKILRNDLQLRDFAEEITSFVAEYLELQIGAFFNLQDDRLTLVASYAYTTRLSNDNQFALGEGMVGQAALEKKTIIFTNVPTDHLALKLNTGIGETEPVAIIVVPLQLNGEVVGVVEFASASEFSKRQVKFLEDMAHAVAVTLQTAKSRSKMAELLIKYQGQSEELKSQQEELKVANEELQEQSAELLKSKHILQEQQEELKVTNEELEEKTAKLLRQQAELVRQRNDLVMENNLKEIRTEAVPIDSGLALSRQNTKITNQPTTVEIKDPVNRPIAPKTNVTTATKNDDRYAISRHDKTTLIIEDDLVFAQTLRKIASKKGYKVLLAENGRDGLLLAEKYCPQAIILDLGLPDMDGMEVLTALKADQTTCHIPVHIASAHDRDNSVLQQGAIGFLSKPATASDLNDVFAKFEFSLQDKPLRLLIVEDDLICLRDTEKIFQNQPVQITVTNNGTETINTLAKQSFDAIILDLGLPDMDGFTLLDKICQIPDFKLPPVVVYTARDMKPDEMALFQDRVTSVVIKGVDSRERLLDEISLFFHAVNSELAVGKQEQIAMHHSGDSNLHGKKIMVVDDDTRNTYALGKIIKKAGMALFKAGDGVQALEQLAKEPDIDLILMDIMMPKMDGYEATRQIRAMPKYEKLPIIALTAKAMREDRDKCLAAGASDYLAKPVDSTKLLSMVRVWIGS